MKLAGTKKYPWGAGSSSDGVALGFDTEVEAKEHADRMNKHVENYDIDPTWNKEHWTSKPMPWRVYCAGQME